MKNKEAEKMYVYVNYFDDINGKLYCYISDDESIEEDDVVLVDRAGYNTVARVVKTKYYDSSSVPYPVEKTKKVIKVLGKSCDIGSEDDGEHCYDFAKNLEYHRLLLNCMFGKIQIRRLMNLIDYSELEGKDLYYYPRFNMLFFKSKNDNECFLAEYEFEIITQEMFEIIIKDSIKVPPKDFDSDSECYTYAREFCKENNLDYFDDTDVLEFSDEKNELRESKIVYEEPNGFESIDEITEYLKNYKGAKWKLPDPCYYIDGDKIIHYIGGLSYPDNNRIFKMLQFLVDNDYVDSKYYNRKNFPLFFEENMSKYDFKNLDFGRLSYTLARLFNVERMCEGIVDSFAQKGYLLVLIERAKYFKAHPDERNTLICDECKTMF